MNKNVGTADKIIRIVVGLVFFGLIAGGVLQGAMAVIFGVLGAVFILTALINFCPIYFALKLSTRGKSAD